MTTTGASPTQSDVLVVGSGMAGLTAALFAARIGLSTRVLCPEGPGGALVSIEEVEDFPGFIDPIAGFELCPNLQEQAQASGAMFDAVALDTLKGDGDSGFEARTALGSFTARAVIVASGTTPRPLGVPGEERLTGRGVSHCASCDGPLYKDRPVAVIGNGDAALKEALTLARCGSRVTVVFEDNDLIAQDTYRRRVGAEDAITVRSGARVEEIVGESVVESLRLSDVATTNGSELGVAAAFIYVGRTPATDFLRGHVDLAQDGRVVTDLEMCTSAAGIFAAGDVRAGRSSHFAVTAAGDGATAALSAARFLAGQA